MDINFIGKWFSFIFFLLSLAVFLYLFFKNTIQLRFSNKCIDLNADVKKERNLVGFAYLFTSLQMALGLYYVLKLNPASAAAHVGFAGFSMLGFALVKYFNDRSVKEFLLLFTPPFLGFVFLSFHVMASLGFFN